MPAPRNRTAARLAPAALALALLSAALALPQSELVIDPGYHHLGDDETPEWEEAPAAPEGNRLSWEFEGPGHLGESVLRLEQRHVDDTWALNLNGHELGFLERGAERVVRDYRVPDGVLRAGKNELVLSAETTTDDITVGDLRLILQSMHELYDLQRLEVRVRDRATGAGIPARVTLVATDGSRPRLYEPELLTAGAGALAVRDGLLYVDAAGSAVLVPAGEYTLHASRGSEWSLDRVDLALASSARVDLALARVVDTTGWVAADTHIHTFGWSNHGDAVPDERQVTLAGEGVELAIATDHNHQGDFAPVQARLALSAYYTPVIGNEVTTSVGHFNAFPFAPEDRLPDASLTDWAAIVAEIRAAGAGFVILNHPRWPDLERGPFGVVELDRSSGERTSGGELTFDAIELVNSTDLKPDPLYIVRDWFALLDHGEWITAVGSSDSHTVSDPVGQGRTYVPSATDDPAAIDVEAAVTAFREGRTTVGLGIFCELDSEGLQLPGETLDLAARTVLPLTVRVAAPEWVRPRTVHLYANGEELLRREIPSAGNGDALPTDVLLEFELARPAHDAWLVAVVLGDGVDGAWWPTSQPYTFACTNPVKLDVDGDGYQSPRETARRLVGGAEDDAAIARVLEQCGEGVAIQVLVAARERFLREAGERFDRTAGSAATRSARLGEYFERQASK